jgi:hypothetical protein
MLRGSEFEKKIPQWGIPAKRAYTVTWQSLPTSIWEKCKL